MSVDVLDPGRERSRPSRLHMPSANVIFRVGVALEVAFAAALSTIIVTKPKFILDGRYVIDDTYYTMTIARSLAHGDGPSASYGTVTSGFQPLQAFILTPFNWLFSDPWHMLRINLALCMGYTLVLIVVIAFLARRIAGTTAGLLAGGIVAFSPTMLRVGAAGLETTLATLCAIGFVATWMWARRSGVTRRWPWVATGVMGGLAVLARIDTLPLVILVVAMQAIFGTRRPIGRLVAGMAVTLAPWWTYAIITFGTPIPQSGTTIASGVDHAAVLSKSAAAVGATTLFGPFRTAGDLQGRMETSSRWSWSVLLFMALMALAAGVSLVVFLHGRRKADRSGASIVDGQPGTPGPPSDMVLALVPLCLWSVAIAGFYVWFGTTYYTYRYVAPIGAVTALVVACLGGRLSRWLSHALLAPGPLRLAPGAVLALILAITMVPQATWVATTKWPVALGKSGVSRAPYVESGTGYARRLYAAFDVIPPGSVIAASQSGVLGWFGGSRGDRVVNLDGVVNPNISHFTDKRGTCGELEKRRVGYLYDFSMMVTNTLFSCGHLPYTATTLRAATPGKNGSPTVIIKLTWHEPTAGR